MFADSSVALVDQPDAAPASLLPDLAVAATEGDDLSAAVEERDAALPDLSAAIEERDAAAPPADLSVDAVDGDAGASADLWDPYSEPPYTVGSILCEGYVFGPGDPLHWALFGCSNFCCRPISTYGECSATDRYFSSSNPRCFDCDGPEDCPSHVCCSGYCSKTGTCPYSVQCHLPADCPSSAPYCCTPTNYTLGQDSWRPLCFSQIPTSGSWSCER
jgi:hypothetical protein